MVPVLTGSTVRPGKARVSVARNSGIMPSRLRRRTSRARKSVCTALLRASSKAASSRELSRSNSVSRVRSSAISCLTLGSSPSQPAKRGNTINAASAADRVERCGMAVENRSLFLRLLTAEANPKPTLPRITSRQSL